MSNMDRLVIAGIIVASSFVAALVFSATADYLTGVCKALGWLAK